MRRGAAVQLPEIPDEIRAWVGQTLIEDEGEFDVERGYVFTSLASVENGNPLYWDAAVAQELTGGWTAPPSMLSVWLRPHYWAPGRAEPRLPLEVHFHLKRALGLPEAIIGGNEIIFGEPVRPGDTIRSRQTLKSISEPRTNKLGTGRFWVIDVDYYNQRGEWVGTESYNCFGYRRT
jgi:acyl dehydratase